MFIYKITVLPLNQCYIGFDTKPEHKQSRWKDHQRQVVKGSNRKLHNAMRTYGVENCVYEVIASEFETVQSLAIAEIEFIKQFDSYKNGLNSTAGGDGFGRYNLDKMSEDEINSIRKSIGHTFTNYNNNVKWADTTKTERVSMMSHLYTKDAIDKRVETQKTAYAMNPELRAEKGNIIREWSYKNPEKVRSRNIKSSHKAIAVNKRSIILELENGLYEYYYQIKDFQEKTGLWIDTIKKKSKNGEFFKGYKLRSYNGELI